MNLNTRKNEAALSTEILKNVYFKRVEKNPRYSLRAFSKSLMVSHTLLSLIFSGKRKISEELANKIIDRLDLTFKQRELFLKDFKIDSNLAPEQERQNEIEHDTFALMSEWQHYAVLSLLETKGFKMNENWIAERLNISPILAKAVISRLKRLDMIEKDSSGVWRQKGGYIRFNNKSSTAATRKFHKQLLMKAMESLLNDPFEIRRHTSITFAMDPSNVPYAIDRINKFRFELSKELEDMGTKKEVYNLTIQLFPFTRGKK